MAFSLPFGQLNSFIGGLQNQAAGRGPSAASRLLQQTNQTQAAQTIGQARAQRGPQSQALALRNAQLINRQRQQATNASAAAMRAQEQNSAQQMLGPLLQQQQAAQYAGVGGAIDTINADKGSANSWLGAAATMAPLLLSDERRKRIVGRARGAGEAAGARVGNSLRRFLRSLNPTQFTYDNEPANAPVRTGVTAQDVARTPEGQRLIVNTPEGAAIDTQAATGHALAGLGSQQAEIDELRAQLAELRGENDTEDDAPPETAEPARETAVRVGSLPAAIRRSAYEQSFGTQRPRRSTPEERRAAGREAPAPEPERSVSPRLPPISFQPAATMRPTTSSREIRSGGTSSPAARTAEAAIAATRRLLRESPVGSAMLTGASRVMGTRRRSRSY